MWMASALSRFCRLRWNLMGSLLGLARRLIQNLFNDVGDGNCVDCPFATTQHFYECGGGRFGAFSQSGHKPNHLAVAGAGLLINRFAEY